jgi:SAM-dependent methyltransferase
MGLKLARKKNRNLKLSIAYRLSKLIPMNATRKLKFLLDLSWIFSRLAHEQIFKTDVHRKPDDKKDFLVSFLDADAKVLDVGCGSGHVMMRLLTKTENIVGVDYDAKAIEIAKQRTAAKNVVLFCDDVFNYLKNNRSARFDYVILSHVLEHIDEPGHFLSSIKKFTRYIYIELPDFEANHLNAFRKIIGTDLVYTDADHVFEFDRNELELLLSECGLTVVKTEFIFGVMKFWCQTNEA